MATTTFNPRVVNSSGDNNTTISMPLQESSGDSEGGVWSWLIPVLGAAAVAVFNNWQEGRRAKQQQEYNEKMYKQQVADNLNFWNLNNAYNAASAQKQRLSDAGLSSLYYGLQNGQAPAEGAQPLGYQRADYSIQNPLFEAAQISNLQANTAKQSEETLSEVKRRDLMAAEIDKFKAELSEIASRTDLNASQKESIDKANSWVDRMNQANIDYLASMKNLNDSQKKRIDELLEGEKIMQSKSIEEFEKKWAMWKAAARKDSALANLAEKDLDSYAFNHMQGGMFGSGVSLINLFRMFTDKSWLDKVPKAEDNLPPADYYGKGGVPLPMD